MLRVLRVLPPLDGALFDSCHRGFQCGVGAACSSLHLCHRSEVGDCRANVKTGEDGRSRGFGIVVYNDPYAAQQAIDSLGGTDLGGREILVRADRGGGGKGKGEGKGEGKGGKGKGKGGKGDGGKGKGKGKGGKPRSASDLDDDLDSYFTSKGGSGEGGEGGGDEGETAPKRGKGKGGGKGKGKGKTEREPATTGGLDDDLDSYFAQKKAATEE